ncbi:hypothetical protein [Streptomyces sp. NPDC008139]|uniref:hypothetical protein n=1 Tax=Streptomyces sp. NPDC008139 TaxID=3364814 RepID=UPI0036ED2E81
MFPPFHRRPGRGWRARIATGAVAVLALVGAGLTSATTAQAATINPTVHCTLPAGQGDATGPQSMTVTLTPAVVTPGGKVHVTVTLGASPAIPGTSLSNVPTTPSMDLAMSGGATGTVTVTGPTVNMNYPSGQPVVVPPYEGDIYLPANASGAITFTPTRTLTSTVVLGGTYQTPCVVTAGGGPVGTVTAQGAGSGASLSGPTGVVRPHTAIDLAGGGWTAGGTPTVSLCDTNGAGCNPADFTSNTLAIDSSGILTGTATLADANTVADGSYQIQVNDGTTHANAPLTVKAFAPTGPRTMTLSQNNGVVGTVITVVGHNFRQDQWINIWGLDAAGNALDDAVYVQSLPDGTFSTDFTIDSADLVAVYADESGTAGTSVTVPFTVTTTAVTLSATTPTVLPGHAATLTGSGWPAGTTPTAALCAADGTACSAASVSSSSLSIASDGKLSGSVTVAKSVATGSYQVQVTAGSIHVLAPLSVATTFITLSPASGPAHTKVTVVGQGWAPVATVEIDGLKADGSRTSDSYATKIIGLDGSWSQTFTVNDPATVALYAHEWLINGHTATAAFAVNGSTAPPAPAYSLSPAAGPVGTSVLVSGRNFAPVATVVVSGRRANGAQSSDSSVLRVIGLDGTFALNFTVRDPKTVGIMAAEVLVNGKTVQLPFTVR